MRKMGNSFPFRTCFHFFSVTVANDNTAITRKVWSRPAGLLEDSYLFLRVLRALGVSANPREPSAFISAGAARRNLGCRLHLRFLISPQV